MFQNNGFCCFAEAGGGDQAGGPDEEDPESEDEEVDKLVYNTYKFDSPSRLTFKND